MNWIKRLLACIACLTLLLSPALAQVLVEDGIALDDQAELLLLQRANPAAVLLRALGRHAVGRVEARARVA